MTSAGRRTTHSTDPTGTGSRTSTAGRILRRSSCFRHGAIRWPPARAATGSSASCSRSLTASCASSVLRTAMATGYRSTTGCPIRPTTRGRCADRRPMADPSGWQRSPPRKRWPVDSGRRRPSATGRIGSSARRSPSTGGCGAAAITPTTTVVVRARIRSWPISCAASGTPTSPGSATSSPPTGWTPRSGRSSRRTSVDSATVGWAP